MNASLPTTANPVAEPAPAAPLETAAQKWERVAFGWCKVATMLLLTAPLGRFALPFVALMTAALFVGAHFRGAQESRCILKRPLLIAAFWGVIGVVVLVVRLLRG